MVTGNQYANVSCGGERGEASVGGSAGSPRYCRMRCTTGRWVIRAIRRRREPQVGQHSTSILNTRRSNSAHE